MLVGDGFLLLLYDVLLYASLTFTRSVGMANAIASGVKTMVNTAVVIGGSSGKAIASVSNHCDVRIPGGTALLFSFMNCDAMRGRMNGGAMVGIRLSSSVRTVSRMIIATVNVGRRGGGVNCAARRVGDRMLGTAPDLGINSTLSKRMTNLLMTGPANVFRTPDFGLHNGTPLIMLSKIPMRASFFSVSDRGVRDIGMLGNATTSTLCNSHKGGKTVLVADGATGGRNLRVGFSAGGVVATNFTILPRARRRCNDNSGNGCRF